MRPVILKFPRQKSQLGNVSATYLNKSNPGDFIVTLHGVPEVVLQSPEFSVQVVVDGDGTGSTKVSLVFTSATNEQKNKKTK